MITGIDIVRQQLLIASGEKVGYRRTSWGIRGHAIECRINAENSETFIPCPGTIDQFHALVAQVLGWILICTMDISSSNYDSI